MFQPNGTNGKWHRRFLRTVFSCSLVVAIAAPANAATNTITSLESDVARFCTDSLIGQPARRVEYQLPKYQQLLATADSLSQFDHYRIDLIGQWHWQQNQNAVEKKKMYQSQRRVFKLLDSLQYQVVGTEGMSVNPITINMLRDTVVCLMKQAGQVTTPDAVNFMLGSWIRTDGAFQYLQLHPDIRLVGYEDEALMELTHRYYQLLHSPAGLHFLSRAQEFQDLGIAIRQARTEIALARMIVELHQANLRCGVIVMGIAHAADYREITARYPGVQWRYFPSIDLSKVSGPQDRPADDLKKKQ